MPFPCFKYNSPKPKDLLFDVIEVRCDFEKENNVFWVYIQESAALRCEKEMIRYLLQVLLTFVILKGVIGEIKDNVCSVCSCGNGTINCKNLKLHQSFSVESWRGNFSNFTEAYFDNNHIGHLVKFPSLPLVKLSYAKNRLVKIDNRAFENLTKLEELILSDNELTSENLLPEIFQGEFDPVYYETLMLKSLDLSANEIHTLHPNLFQHLTLLEELYLKQNPFKILDKPTVVAISSLPNLKILDLSFTKIKELPMGFLHTPKKLTALILIGNLFREVPSDVLAESHNLEILNLNENPIKVLSTDRPFPEMPSLKQLHISSMPNLTRIEEGSLSGLINLDYLHCSMNEKLGYISPKAFKSNKSEKFPNLFKLDLNDNNLRYIDHDFLKPVWNKIKHINILGNPLVCDCENQWIVSELVPLMKNTSSPIEGLICEEPSAMKGQRLTTLFSKNYTMRCLDLYGNHPENDGPILIAIFVVIILSLMVILGVVVWIKSDYTCRQGGRVNYHRAFYRQTKMEDPDRY